MRILVALDGGEAGERAAASLATLVREAGWEAHLFSVVDPDTVRAYGDNALTEREDYLRDVAARHLAGLAVHVGIDDSDRPADSIVNAAKKVNADLIAMGSHARGRLGHFMFGSVAGEVARTSPVPVIIAGPNTAPDARLVPAAPAAPRPAPAASPVVQEQLRQLQTGDWAARRSAREVLSGMGANAIPGLEQALREGSRELRWEAASILGDLADPRSIPAIVEALEDSDGSVRWAAGDALIGMGWDAVAPLLRRLLAHADSPQLQEAAHRILRAVGDERTSRVIFALEEPFAAHAVPTAASEALKQIGG